MAGRNFFNRSVVVLNGVKLKTRFISSILLEADAIPDVMKSTGDYPVNVVNPFIESANSNSLYIKVVDADDPLLKAASKKDQAGTASSYKYW